MSVPSNSRNFTSIGSFPPAISTGRIAGAFHTPTNPFLLLPRSQQATGETAGAGEGNRTGIQGGRKGLPEIRAGRASTDADPTRGSDLLREDLELLRGGQSDEETGVSRRRTGGDRRNGICERFNRYTLCDLDIYF